MAPDANNDAAAAPLPVETLVQLTEGFADQRGVLLPLIQRPIGSVVFIESRQGTTRASHWHREDWHYCYVQSGEIHYFERPVGGADSQVTMQIFTAGDLFFTPPNVEHEMYFYSDTEFFTFANRHRDQADYEADLVRFELGSLRTAWKNGQTK